MEKVVLHPAQTRGHADLGWLDSFHTFSFGDYYEPKRMHFGVLRVLNDDSVAPGRGFGAHPHDNMEIISLPLEGNLEHKDSMGNITVIKKGDIQVMSAGTGVTHSEYNSSKEGSVKFLQIWLFPNQQNVMPRYDQRSLNLEDRRNKLQQILSPNGTDDGVWIYQDAWFSLGIFDERVTTSYTIKKSGNGVYLFVLSGKLSVSGHQLEARDGIGFWDLDNILIISQEQGTEYLIMDVPMELPA